MPCTTQPNLTAQRQQQIKDSIARLERALSDGSVRVIVGANGAIAFKGAWRNDGVMDACAFRLLRAAGSGPLRSAIARAEVMAGRKISEQAIAAGVHSHDGGASWYKGH